MTPLRSSYLMVIRQWHSYEVSHNGSAIIDYDCLPSDSEENEEALDRIGVYQRLNRLKSEANMEQDLALVERLTADLAYLEALLGSQQSLEDYISCTQGCAAAGWAPDYVVARGEVAKKLLEDRGVSWGPRTLDELERLEGRLAPEDAAQTVRALAEDLESRLRQYSGAQAKPSIEVETVDVNEYWAYWLDGQSQKVRLKLNLRKAAFTTVRARLFAVHELLGHAIQYANISLAPGVGNAKWLPIFSVHATNQILFEGLAQALPLFITPEDQELAVRVRLDHYTQLVRAELHVAINRGSNIASCVEHAHQRVPWWTDEEIGDLLTDRSVSSPLLRSYLWAYPAGCDWFINLADEAPSEVAQEVIRAAYITPFSPAELEEKWRTGPPIGGGGQSIRLR